MNDNVQIAASLELGDPAHDGFTLDVDTSLPGEGVTAIFGASGSGKTTLLRCVAGLTRPDPGRIVVDGQVWQDDRDFRPTHQRALGYVFQEANLFPHLTATGNLRFAQRHARRPSSTDNYASVVEMFDLQGLVNRYPQQLSGGERQRVALARALLTQPDLLLMDEPLASLDTPRKAEILTYLKRMRDETRVPILYVTHAMEEVTRLADHALVMRAGRIAAQGDLADVFSANDAAQLTDNEPGVVLQGKVNAQDKQWQLNAIALNDETQIWVRDGGEPLHAQVRLQVLARDVSVTLSAQEDTSILNRLPARVLDIQPDVDEAFALVHLDVGSQQLLARLTRRSVSHLSLAVGHEVWAQIKSVAVVR